MASNKKTREELKKLFGDECWVDKLDLKARTIFGEYKGKSVEQLKEDKKLVYHHIIMKKDGGKNTIANGALMSKENHEWFHKQKQWKQDKMNEYFQQYKINCILAHFDDEMAVHATKLQIDYDELDDENYFMLQYDPELDALDTKIYERAKELKEGLQKKNDREDRE